ncbi:hypothetical protein ACFL2V_06825 [Pseudomonadota bacterium]
MPKEQPKRGPDKTPTFRAIKANTPTCGTPTDLEPISSTRQRLAAHLPSSSLASRANFELINHHPFYQFLKFLFGYNYKTLKGKVPPYLRGALDAMERDIRAMNVDPDTPMDSETEQALCELLNILCQTEGFIFSLTVDQFSYQMKKPDIPKK